MAMKPNGKSPVTSDHGEKIMLFRDVTPGPHETQLRFRLIYFWEAWNPLKKTLIGLEMLLIDEQGSVIQGFISPGRIERYLPKMKPGSVYKLNNFYGSSNKTVYRVSDHAVTVSFSWNSELSVLEDSPTPFEEDRFRFHSFEDFQASCDRKGDLYDVVGHMKLVNGQSGDSKGEACVGSCAVTRKTFLRLDIYSLCSLNRLGSNPPSAELVNAEVVTKRETLTIGEIFSYIKQGSTKLCGPGGFFECTATIDDVVHGSTWYRAQISVYDNSEQAVFALLGDAGFELTGKHHPILILSILVLKLQLNIGELDCQANGNQEVSQEVPFPEALISTIGQKHKFCVKVTKHNLDGKSRSLTVTKILPLDTPPVTESLGENYNPATLEKHLRLEPTCVKLPKSVWILQRGVREIVTLMRWAKLNASSVGCRAFVCRLISCKGLHFKYFFFQFIIDS
uniref:DUF223 domain-containing protein n=1 Tax=Brassica oleracea var. oleracea TaxID=109376 RepID=A0A0D3CIH1_BRAOL